MPTTPIASRTPGTIITAAGGHLAFEVAAGELGLGASRGEVLALHDPALGGRWFRAGATVEDTTVAFAETVQHLRRDQADLLTDLFAADGITWRVYTDPWAAGSDFEAWEGGLEAEDADGGVVNSDGYIPFGLPVSELRAFAEGLIQ